MCANGDNEGLSRETGPTDNDNPAEIRVEVGSMCGSKFPPTPVPGFPVVPAKLRTDVCFSAIAINRPPRIFPKEMWKYFGV